MEVKFVYDDVNHVLIKQYNGIISIEDMIQTWIGAFLNGYFDKPIKGIVIDFRCAYFSFPLLECYRISNFFHKNLQYFGGLKIALIADTPGSIIYPFRIQSNDNGYTTHPFTTFEGAMHWILW